RAVRAGRSGGRLAAGVGAGDGDDGNPRVAQVARHDERAVRGDRSARDVERRQRIDARADVPDRIARRRSPRGRRRASRWTDGVGKRSATLKEERVARNDDEKEFDRRDFLKCMAWVGTGAVWTLSSGVLKGSVLGQSGAMKTMARGGNALRFVQISDSHIGFDKPANADVTATLRLAIAKINADPDPPAFVLHTGDLTHLSRPAEFDTLQQVLSELSVPVFYVPGEHDVLDDNGKAYLQRFGKGTVGGGWHSFDHAGAHFIGLVNVVNLEAGGLGSVGAEQLAWLERDVKRLKDSTPIVVFAHIPLWSVYPDWGWGTDDSEQALSYLKRFGSVSVLNGHIHQVMQKVEGHVTFHT